MVRDLEDVTEEVDNVINLESFDLFGKAVEKSFKPASVVFAFFVRPAVAEVEEIDAVLDEAASREDADGVHAESKDVVEAVSKCAAGSEIFVVSD